MNFTFGNTGYLLLLLVLPVVLYLAFRFSIWRESKRTLFAEEKFHGDLFEKKSKFSKILPFLYGLGILFLIFAVVDVLSGTQEMKIKQNTHSVLFVLDVSNSMNAQDIEPSRLEQAKKIMLNTLHEMNGDKVGIVVFAGEARSIMPLTTDYSAADTYIAGIESSIIARQGTDFLQAIQTANDKFKNIPKGAKKIILISDGEDNEGNDKAAIKEANKQGISITTVGIGKEDGAPIPEYYYNQYMDYKRDASGQAIITKRETQALKTIASDTDGAYIDGNNAEEAVNKIINHFKNQKGSSEMIVNTQNANHYYQWFLGVSIFLFFLIYFFNPRRDLNL
ncbi:MAG: VWA domain-containing protein [Cloacibacterium sp.]|nr:VWA domain-containing protein [Cloacibacterium sp.]